MSRAMSRGDRWRVFARSLLLQACWSQERMQCVGFAHALWPWLNRLYRSRTQRLEALARHQSYFNTHPFMAPIALGMVCALEEEAAGESSQVQAAKWSRIAALKSALATSLAGIGDALFWGALRPASAALAALAGCAAWAQGARAQAPWVMVGVYLAFFDVPALALRWRGLAMGYEWKDQIVVRLKQLPWQAWIKQLRRTAAALAALIVLCATVSLPTKPRAGGLLVLAFYLGAARIGGPIVTPSRVYAGFCVLGALAAVARWR